MLAQHFGCARHIYNWALGEKKAHYELTGKSLSRRQLQDLLVASKKKDKLWLKEVNSQSLLASLQNLDTAFTNFFRKQAQFPRFKKKNSGWQSFQCPQHVKVSFGTERISLPKIANIKAVLHRTFVGQIKTVTVKRSPSGKYFASVLVDDNIELPVSAPIEHDKTLGIDVGISHFAITSDGDKIDNPNHLKQALQQLAIAQKILSRKKQGSANRFRQKQTVAIVHERVSNRRNDFIHQTTAILADKNQATSFAVENLNIKAMLRNNKLARAIADCGWGNFILALEYKSKHNGKNLLKIDRFAPSSKRCGCCGYIVPTMPLSVRNWQCPDCNTNHDRDVNAANNIKQFALADALGQSGCIKSSPVAPHVSACAIAKGTGMNLRCGSQEAPTRNASAV